MDESQVEDKEQVESVDDKQTNRVFTQSEVDKMVAGALKKAKEETGDYNELKVKLEELEKEKKEKELEEMTELEKYKVKIQEMETLQLEKEKQLFAFKKKSALNEILSDKKYSQMPKAYKNLVAYSDDPETMIKSAEDAFNEYEKDFGTGIKESFGIPTNKTADAVKNARTVIRGAGDMQAALKAQIMEKINKANKG